MTFFYTSVDMEYNKILFRGYKDGKRIKKKVEYTPTLYVECKEKSEFKTLDGKFVTPMSFESMKESREFTKKYKDVTNFKIYGNTNYPIQFISDIWPGHINFDMTVIDIGAIDIEVAIGEDGFPHPEKAEQEIITITYHSSQDKTYICWGMKDYFVENSILKDVKIKYIKCRDEVDLLLKFMDYWMGNYPDILTGWNLDGFDLVYIINRLKKILSDDISNKFSPWNKVEETTDYNLNGDEIQAYNISGIQVIDYMKAFKKFAYKYPKQENYKLGNIGFVVLGEEKLDYSEYKGLTELYEKNFQRFCDYNIKDVVLIVKMEEQLNLFYLIATIAYMTKSNLQDAFSPVASWDNYIYNELCNRNIVIPPKVKKEKLQKIEGAFVKEPIVGKYNWIMSFDATSLYPMLMIQSNMSPETIIDKFSRYMELKQEAEKRGIL